MMKLRLVVGATAVAIPLAFAAIPASGAALNTFQTTKPETTPPLHGTLPHGEGTVAVTQLLPSSARPYSNDPSGITAPSELLVVGRARGEMRADGTYHGHITIAQVAGIELLSIDTNPGETKTGPLDSITSGLCSSTGGAVCLGVVTANSATTTTGSTNHFAVANLQLGGLPGVTLPPGVLSALGATAASADGNIATDPVTGCQTSTGDTLITNANLGPTILADVIKSSTISKACPGQTPTETDSSTVIPTTGTITNLLTTVPNSACATGGNPNPDGSAGGTANTVSGIPVVLDLVCNAADQNPGVATNSSEGGQQATSPYGVREGLDAFVLALGGGPALVKLSTAASDSTATAQAAQAATCPAGQTGTPPNCTTPPPTKTPSTHVCNTGGDNDCVTGSGPTGPSIKEGGATDLARDCREGVENTPACPGAKTTGNNGAGTSGPATAQPRSTLPFTGLDVLPVGLLGLVLLGTGLALRRFSGMVD